MTTTLTTSQYISELLTALVKGNVRYGDNFLIEPESYWAAERIYLLENHPLFGVIKNIRWRCQTKFIGSYQHRMYTVNVKLLKPCELPEQVSAVGLVFNVVRSYSDNYVD